MVFSSAKIKIRRSGSPSGQVDRVRREGTVAREEESTEAPQVWRTQMPFAEAWEVVLPAGKGHGVEREVLARALAWLMNQRHKDVSTAIVNDSIDITNAGALRRAGAATNLDDPAVDHLTDAILESSGSVLDKILETASKPVNETDLGLPGDEVVQKSIDHGHQVRGVETASELAQPENVDTNSLGGQTEKRGRTGRKI